MDRKQKIGLMVLVILAIVTVGLLVFIKMYKSPLPEVANRNAEQKVQQAYKEGATSLVGEVAELGGDKFVLINDANKYNINIGWGVITRELDFSTNAYVMSDYKKIQNNSRATVVAKKNGDSYDAEAVNIEPGVKLFGMVTKIENDLISIKDALDREFFIKKDWQTKVIDSANGNNIALKVGDQIQALGKEKMGENKVAKIDFIRVTR